MIDVVKISKALSDPIRYKILLMLVDHQSNELLCCSPALEGACNCEIMAEFGMIQSRVSYHMKELTGAGLVTEEPRGKWKFYSLNMDTLKEYTRQIGADFKF
ncbi:HTH-type transcriptional repressor AseR [Peptococcaceae bacterium CEB3]|nr:HTH-type transcriptional repressor AseR [Peptococcaceae bacterium CEB3]